MIPSYFVFHSIHVARNIVLRSDMVTLYRYFYISRRYYTHLDYSNNVYAAKYGLENVQDIKVFQKSPISLHIFLVFFLNHNTSDYSAIDLTRMTPNKLALYVSYTT